MARRIPHLFLIALLVSACLPPAWAVSSAEIVQTHPAADATLGISQSFYVRIAYRSDEPISLWARPYRNGEASEKAMSNASARHDGEGEALGWFALTEAGDVDEVRILAGGGKPYREWELARYEVQLRWTASSSSDDSTTPWVEELKAIDAARMREDAERRANEPVTAGDVAFLNGFMLLMLALGVAGIGVPLWSAWKWQGGWRVAAMVPVAVLGFVVLRIVVDTARDPTSHNLWPFEIIMFGALGLVIIGILKAARRFMDVQA